jgi:hypothetical protein
VIVDGPRRPSSLHFLAWRAMAASLLLELVCGDREEVSAQPSMPRASGRDAFDPEDRNPRHGMTPENLFCLSERIPST